MFHHTTDEAADLIMENGLRQGAYATPRVLSPLQAHINLALSPDRVRNAVIAIDTNGLRAAGYEMPYTSQVAGRFGMAGGGWEMRFPYAVPAEFIRRVQ